jgi:hypothetical protein
MRTKTKTGSVVSMMFAVLFVVTSASADDCSGDGGSGDAPKAPCPAGCFESTCGCMPDQCRDFVGTFTCMNLPKEQCAMCPR